MAHANATITVTGTAPHKTLTYTVDDARDHAVQATVSNDDLVISDNVDVAAGCSPLGPRSVTCGPADDFERLVFLFGPGSDQLHVWAPIAMSVDGGDGSDLLAGGVLGDEVACGPGADIVYEHDDDDAIDDDCETIDPPYLDGDPAIVGDPRVGSPLTLTLPPNLGSEGIRAFVWLRCDARGSGCTPIDESDAATYTPTPADLGRSLRAAYTVVNALGGDTAYSAPTIPVRAARQPPAPRPSVIRPPVPSAPSPPMRAATPRPSIFAALGKPKLVVRGRRAVVDTGRAIGCPNLGTSSQCGITATAAAAGRPTGRTISAHLHGGQRTRLLVTLNARAYRLLRAHRKLTIHVMWRISRPVYGAVGSTFTITVKLPKRR